MSSCEPSLIERGALMANTLRFLPARQVAHLAWARTLAPHVRRVPRIMGTPRVNAGLSFRVPPFPVHRCSSPSREIRERRLTFLNHTVDLRGTARWGDESLPLLWRYNLHYFDYLWNVPWEDARRLILDWIESNPPPGSPAWDPYPLSVRCMNWIGLLADRFRAPFRDEPPDVRAAVLSSLYVQGKFLRANLERHLDGNHLFKNVAALYLLGSYFEGGEAAEWRASSAQMLEALTAYHFLPDGGHFERSPMYHALALLDLLRVLNVAGAAPLRDRLAPIAGRAARVAAQMATADGEVLLLNDSAKGIALSAGEVLRHAERILGEPVSGGRAGSVALPDTGYYIARSRRDRLVVDAGEVGPDCQPGHAHGDLLSFELAFDGHPVIVDSGVCEYDRGPMRDYARSTAAHNTVEVDGEDQCEFWAAFRVGRRGRPREVRHSAAPGSLKLSAWHDGYHRLAGKPSHRREFSWLHGILRVKDSVEGRGHHTIRSRLHFHPRCSIQAEGEKEVFVDYGGGHARVTFFGPGRLTVEEGWYCPEFGRKLRNPTLVFEGEGSSWRGGYVVTKDMARSLLDNSALPV